MDQEDKSIEQINKSLQGFFSKRSETRCQSYKFARKALEQGIQLEDKFIPALADCIGQESPLNLASLLKFVNIFILSHKEKLSNDYNCYPVFKSLLVKYKECVHHSRSRPRILDITMENIMSTFPRNFTLIMALRFFGEQSLPMDQSVIETGLFIAQAVAQVTGEDVPLISSFLPFAVLRKACANFMDIRMISLFRKERSPVCHWTEDLLTALWYLNRPEMMTVFKSLTGAFQEIAVELIMNYGVSKHRAFVLDSELPVALRAEIIELEEENVKTCSTYKCGDSTDTQEFEQFKSLQKADLPPIGVPGTSSVDPITAGSDETSDDEEVEHILPTQIFYASKRDIPPSSVASSIDLFKKIMGKNTAEEELQVGLDNSKSETCTISGSKVAARQSILNLLSNPKTFTASKEDLSQLESDMKKKTVEHTLSYEIKPGGIQESVELIPPDYQLLNESMLEKISEEDQEDFSQAADFHPSDKNKRLCNEDFDGTGASLKTSEIKEEIIVLGEREMLDNLSVPHSSNTMQIVDLYPELGNKNRQDSLGFQHTANSCPNVSQTQEVIAKYEIEFDEVPDVTEVLEDPHISQTKKSIHLQRLSDEESPHNLEHTTQSIPDMSTIQVEIAEVPQEELKCDKGGDGTEGIDDLQILQSEKSITSEPGLSVGEKAHNRSNETLSSPNRSQIQELFVKESQKEIKCDEVPARTEVLDDLQMLQSKKSITLSDPGLIYRENTHNLEYTTQLSPEKSESQEGIVEAVTSCKGLFYLHGSQSKKSIVVSQAGSDTVHTQSLEHTLEFSAEISQIQDGSAKRIKYEEFYEKTKELDNVDVSQSKVLVSDDDKNISNTEQTSQSVSPSEIQALTVGEVEYDFTESEVSEEDFQNLFCGWKYEPGLEMQDEEPGDGLKKIKSEVSETLKDAENIPISEVKKETDKENETEIKSSLLPDDLKVTEEDSETESYSTSEQSSSTEEESDDPAGAVRFTSTAKPLTGLPVTSAQREGSAECEPPPPAATSSGTSYKTASASISKFKSIVSTPSKIMSLFKAKRFKSQTTICEENKEQTAEEEQSEAESFSIESKTQICTVELKKLKLQIESLNNEIDGCTEELNKTVLEIEQLQKQVLYQNKVIRDRKRKMREKGEKYKVSFS